MQFCLCMIQVDFTLEWDSEIWTVHATSEWSAGVCRACTDRPSVAATGRYSERWRFKFGEPVRLRLLARSLINGAVFAEKRSRRSGGRRHAGYMCTVGGRGSRDRPRRRVAQSRLIYSTGPIRVRSSHGGQLAHHAFNFVASGRAHHSFGSPRPWPLRPRCRAAAPGHSPSRADPLRLDLGAAGDIKSPQLEAGHVPGPPVDRGVGAHRRAHACRVLGGVGAQCRGPSESPRHPPQTEAAGDPWSRWTIQSATRLASD